MCVYSTVGLSVDPPPTEKSKYVDGLAGMAFYVAEILWVKYRSCGSVDIIPNILQVKSDDGPEKDLLENQSKHFI